MKAGGIDYETTASFGSADRLLCRCVENLLPEGLFPCQGPHRRNRILMKKERPAGVLFHLLSQQDQIHIGNKILHTVNHSNVVDLIFFRIGRRREAIIPQIQQVDFRIPLSQEGC